MKKPLMTVGMVEKAEVKDRCVVCDCETPFDINEHIDFRMGYIEGVGQLCLNCYDKIYYEPKVRKEEEE